MRFNKLTKVTSFAVTCSLFCLSSSNAGTVSKIEIDPMRADLNKSVSVKLQFASEDVSCGLKIDWGNGKVEKLRVGKDQQLKAPYLIENVYPVAGSFRVVVSGELIARGLKTLLPCDVSFSEILQVTDPVIEARLAEEKFQREKLEKEQREAEIAEKKRLAEAEIAEKKRLAEEAAARRERALAAQKEARAAEEREKAAQAEREKYVPVTSKRYVAFFKCEQHAWNGISESHVLLAIESFRVHGEDGLKRYAKGSHNCTTTFEPIDASKVSSLAGARLYKSEGAADYIVYTVSNGFKSVTSGNSSTMLPTWTLFAIMGK
jgi:hypothetical protein